jgi:hypothetical protein
MTSTFTIVSQNITTLTVSASSTMYTNVVQYQHSLQLQYRYLIVDSVNNSNDNDSGMDTNITITTFEGRAMPQLPTKPTLTKWWSHKLWRWNHSGPSIVSKKYQSIVQMNNIVPFTSVSDIEPPQFITDETIVPTSECTNGGTSTGSRSYHQCPGNDRSSSAVAVVLLCLAY